MKNFFALILFTLTMGLAFGQGTASVKSAKELTSIKESGKGQIILPESITKEMVEKHAGYYTIYFTIDFNEKTHFATFNMVENSERSRQIITRFLASCQITHVEVDGEKVYRGDLFERFLK